MTVREAIERADDIKPNAFSFQVKTQWLSELEGRLALNVFLLAPAEAAQMRCAWPEDQQAQLLVEPPHDDIYPLWLAAKIDEANGEFNKYQNTMQVYNGHYGDFVRWFAHTCEPAQGYQVPAHSIPVRERNR